MLLRSAALAMLLAAPGPAAPAATSVLDSAPVLGAAVPRGALVLPAAPEADGASGTEVGTPWWVWVALGAAVLGGAGAATAVALGSDGGPSSPVAATGGVRGSY